MLLDYPRKQYLETYSAEYIIKYGYVAILALDLRGKENIVDILGSGEVIDRSMRFISLSNLSLGMNWEKDDIKYSLDYKYKRTKDLLLIKQEYYIKDRIFLCLHWFKNYYSTYSNSRKKYVVNFKITQEQLAMLLGCMRISYNRALKYSEMSKFITRELGYICISKDFDNFNP